MTEKIPLDELLPQARPMVLLSDYAPPADEAAVEAFVDVTPQAPFFEPALDGVPGCVALEYMAQTMALCVGLLRRRKGLPPQIGFVLGSRRLDVRIPAFRSGARYCVRVACTFQDEEFGSFDCSIREASGRVVASGALTAFQPGAEDAAALGRSGGLDRFSE